MRDKAADAAQMEIKRNDFLKTGFRLFSEKSIETVTLTQVAEAAGYGQTTAVATWKWEQFREENKKRRPSMNFEGMSAAEIFGFYLDSFLELYRNHKDLLRFNQFFNVYMLSEHIDAGTLQPYQEMIQHLRERFHIMYARAEQDHTIRTDEPEDKMFSKTLHLMLASATRYAVGLVYTPEGEFDPEDELLFLKNVLMEKYTGA